MDETCLDNFTTRNLISPAVFLNQWQAVLFSFFIFHQVSNNFLVVLICHISNSLSDPQQTKIQQLFFWRNLEGPWPLQN